MSKPSHNAEMGRNLNAVTLRRPHEVDLLVSFALSGIDPLTPAITTGLVIQAYPYAVALTSVAKALSCRAERNQT
jgi:hypothetical protein